MQNQMGGRVPHMMMSGMMAQQHPQMMGQGPPPGIGPGQLIPGGMQPGAQMQQHPTHPIPHPALQAQQAPPTPGAEQPKLDNISRAKALVPTLKELVSNVFRTAAEATYANNLVDSGTKPVEFDPNKFDKALEEFYSVCDHMEMHLKSSMECISQGGMSQQNLSATVSQTKMDGALSYPEFVGVVQSQIAYAREVHDALADAAQKLLD